MAAYDFSVFKKFNFERPPVGVKFLYEKPKGIQKLKVKKAFCQMLPEAHKGKPFYAGREDHDCHGTFGLGQTEIPPNFGSGAVVADVGQVNEPRAGREVYRTLPKLEKGTVNYVVFSPLDKMTFDPDVLVFTATIEQAEILMRASTYTNGRLWTSKTSVVLGCAWLFVYPYISGEVNYMIMGICAGGMLAGKLLPVGLVLVSIPFQQMPTVIDNLQKMPWKPWAQSPPESVKQSV